MVSRKTLKKIDLENFRSESFSELVLAKFSVRSHSPKKYVPLKAGLPLPSSCCKGEACLPRSLQLDFLISPAKLDFFISPATAGRLLKILTMLLYEGIQE